MTKEDFSQRLRTVETFKRVKASDNSQPWRGKEVAWWEEPDLGPTKSLSCTPQPSPMVVKYCKESFSVPAASSQIMAGGSY